MSAVTITPLVQKYKERVTVSKLKYVYTVFKNAERLSVSEYGDVSGWNFYYSSSDKFNQSFWETYFLPYIKYSPCEYSQRYIYSVSKKGVFRTFQYPAYCLSDGIVFWGVSIASNGFLIGKKIVFDINGSKGPNIYGKDVFELYISKPIKKGAENYADGSYYITPKCPAGLSFCAWGTYHAADGWYWESDDEVISDCYDSAGNLNSCGYIIQQNSWKIPDNYPIKF